jgi:hypothetical protein
MKHVLLIFTLTFTSFFAHSQSLTVNKKDLKKLAKIMSGTFSSFEQSKSDSTFFHVSLQMAPIWKKAKDGYWLYVEQAMASAKDKPYRQRVYHLYVQDDTTLVSKVYEIQNPKEVINAWTDKSKLDLITKEKLIDRQGCSIYLQKTKEGYFKGSTPGKDCLSTLRGAAYATSEVVINKDSIVSWDRGWDKDDKQVWGAVKKGYIFVKEK